MKKHFQSLFPGFLSYNSPQRKLIWSSSLPWKLKQFKHLSSIYKPSLFHPAQGVLNQMTSFIFPGAMILDSLETEKLMLLSLFHDEYTEEESVRQNNKMKNKRACLIKQKGYSLMAIWSKGFRGTISVFWGRSQWGQVLWSNGALLGWLLML